MTERVAGLREALAVLLGERDDSTSIRRYSAHAVTFLFVHGDALRDSLRAAAQAATAPGGAVGGLITELTLAAAGGMSRNRDINEWRTDIAAGFFTLDVEPSTRAMDRREFYRSLRTPEGSGLLSRFAHPSRVAAREKRDGL